MTSLVQNRITVAVAVGLPLAVGLWLLTSGSTAVPSTYVFVALLVISTLLIGLNTWNNGQPAASLAQVMYDADKTRLAEPSSTGRGRALLAVSVAFTGALLLYAWFM